MSDPLVSLLHLLSGSRRYCIAGYAIPRPAFLRMPQLRALLGSSHAALVLELSDKEWSITRPMLPAKPRGVPRVDDRRVLNGIFWVLRSGAPWRDLPALYGPRTTCYNRFVRWRRAGIWDGIMPALTAAHDAAVQMIDRSMVRVHQHAACIADSSNEAVGRSRGGLTSKLHVVVDADRSYPANHAPR
jgi:transposase